MFDPAIVTVTGDYARILVAVSRAYEPEQLELTNQQGAFSYAGTDHIESAASEIASFIKRTD